MINGFRSSCDVFRLCGLGRALSRGIALFPSSVVRDIETITLIKGLFSVKIHVASPRICFE